MTIYVVTSGNYSEYKIEGVFSTKEKAEAFALVVGDAIGDVNDIEEYSIDERVEDVVVRVWVAFISLKSGASVREPFVLCTRASNPRFTETNLYPDGPDTIISVKSAVSGEHALKVAAETRQNMLREAALDQEQSVDPA